MRRPLTWLLLPACLSSAIAFADEAAIREKLRSRVQVKFDDTPLVDVLKNLGEQAGVKFWIAEEEIRADNGTVEETVTLDWGEMQLDSALYFILERMNDLAAVPGENDVIVTTVNKRSEEYTTRVYPLGMILDGMQREFTLRKVSASHVREILTGMGGMNGSQGNIRSHHHRSQGFMGQGFFQFGGKTGNVTISGLSMGPLPPTIGETVEPVWLTAEPVRRTELARALARSVKDTVRDCWDTCEGVGGKMDLADEALVVTIGPAEHDQIAVLLMGIERNYTEDQAPVFQWAIRSGYPVRDDQVVQKSLDQIGNFAVTNQPLEKTLNELALQAGVRLWFDRRGIQQDGGSLAAEVTFTASGLPYREILSRLLHQNELDYVVEEGVVIVDTMTRIDERTYPAIYDTAGIPEAAFATPWNYFPAISDLHRRSQLLVLMSSHLVGLWHNDEAGTGGTSAFQLTPSVMIVNQPQQTHRKIAKLLADLRKRPRAGGPLPDAARQPDLKPEFLTRIYPVFDPEAVEPSVTILKKLLVNDQVKLIEVVKESIVIQCSDEGHIRAEAYFEAIESAHRRRQERIKPAPTPTPTPTPTSSPTENP